MGADGQVEAEETTAVQALATAKVQRRTIALGVALGFVAAGVVGGALVVAGGSDEHGGGSERIADVQSTTTVGEAVSTTAAPVTTAAAPATSAGAPVSGGGAQAAADPVPIEQQVADHEVRITELEQSPPPTTAAPPPPAAPVTTTTSALPSPEVCAVDPARPGCP